MNCINLQEQFGERYRITFDPAYDPRHRPKDKLDPRMMQVECKRGAIFPHGGQLLAAEVEGRSRTRKRLKELVCTTLHQVGDDFLCVLFDVKDFIAVADTLKPRKKRQVSEAEKRRLRTLSAQHGFKSQSHQPEREKRPLTQSSEFP